MRRRQSNGFNLSFLDIMSCGLGAAVLLFLIIKHNTDRTIETSDLASSETNLLAEEIRIGQENLAARGLARKIQDEIDALRGQIGQLGPSSEKQIQALEQQIETLEKQKQTLDEISEGGNRVREFIGDGNRQYLTGLNMGGDHSLILLDTSSSMLDETIINVIRRRNRSDDVKIASPKWQQAIAIINWISANLPAGTNFQIYNFNETAQVALTNTEGSWISTLDTERLEQAIEAAGEMAPDKGTNLASAFEVIDQFSPRPDNIFLITDGLPTMGVSKPKGTSVTSNERIQYFNEAYALVPRDIPVNVLLLPMEGDPFAAAAFWRLAIQTSGSFIAPPRDWPN